MAPQTVRAWRVVHTWTSLVCTLFLLMLCLTGLPLVFHEEIDAALRREPPYPAAPAGAHASLDDVAARARRAYPREHVRTLYLDDDAPQIGVTMTPQADGNFDHFHALFFDARTGAPRIDQLRDRPSFDLTGFLLKLHVDMFTGLPGELFLGVMGLLFLASLVSGAVLYAPFMRKLEFGAVRKGGSGRLKWLDLHNLIGVVALAWMAVVGFTGALNAFSQPLFAIWQMTEVAPKLRAYARHPLITPTAGLDRALMQTQAVTPGMKLDFISMPSKTLGYPAQYAVWMKGDRTLTSRLLTPVLVNAADGRVVMKADMPWYLRLLEVSRPLHFGDYGGLPLKLLWAVLDLFTILVLGTGVYLWVAKRRWSFAAPELIGAEAEAVGAAAARSAA